MTRVFHAMAGAPVGGAEEFFTRLLPALSRVGEEQAAGIRPHTERERILLDAGIPVETHRFGGFFDWRTGAGLRRQIEAFAPDIVFAWMSRAAKFCPAGDHISVGRLGGYYDLKYYQRCDHLVGNTKDICAYIEQRGWPAMRIHYLPNFVDGAPGTPLDRSAFDTPDDAPLLLAMGRLHENKAFDVLLAALEASPGAFLWIAGEGPLRRSLIELTEHLDLAERVRFLGWRTDPRDLLASCDILICPSRHEPLGNVVLEAWAQRKPVIATEALGPKSLLTPDRTGLLVPIDDAPALGSAIRSLLASKERLVTLAEQGFKAYQEGFTEARVTALYQQFFETVTT